MPPQRPAQDFSRGFLHTRLFLDALDHRAPGAADGLLAPERIAVTPMRFQRVPAAHAVRQKKPRILLADGDGLGKTVQAAMLACEFALRGRADRILVIAPTEKTEALRQEFQERCSLTLELVDTDLIREISSLYPWFSRDFLQRHPRLLCPMNLLRRPQVRYGLGAGQDFAPWDVIVVDEAWRLDGLPQLAGGAGCAEFLGKECGALVMLSSRIHDGRPEKLDHLLRILEPKSPENPGSSAEEKCSAHRCLISRCRRDVEREVQSELPARTARIVDVPCSPGEEAVFSMLRGSEFAFLDADDFPRILRTRTALIKAFLSSPQAGIALLQNTLRRLEERLTRPGIPTKKRAQASRDRALLLRLQKTAEASLSEDSPKLRVLDRILSPEGELRWTRGADDRLVVFTESDETLRMLAARLPSHLDLSSDAVLTLPSDAGLDAKRGASSAFGNPASPVKVLIASDRTADGLCLHAGSHRVVHCELPWSLTTLRTRNAAVHRWGQKHPVEILCLRMCTEQDGMPGFGDGSVLTRLIEKDERSLVQVDLEGVFGTPAKEAALTAALFDGSRPRLREQEVSGGAALRGEVASPRRSPESLIECLRADVPGDALREAEESGRFFSAWEFVHEVLQCRLHEPFERGGLDAGELQLEEDALSQSLSFRSPPGFDFEVRNSAPKRALRPESGRWELSADAALVARRIAESRLSPSAPRPPQMLNELHPVLQWSEDWALSAFGEGGVPVVFAPEIFPDDEVWTVLLGGLQESSGTFPAILWTAVRLRRGAISVVPKSEFFEKLSPLPRLPEAKPLSARELEVLSEFMHSSRRCMDQMLERRRLSLGDSSGSHRPEKIVQTAAVFCGRLTDPEAFLADARRNLESWTAPAAV